MKTAMIFIENKDQLPASITFELLGKIKSLHPECKVIGVTWTEQSDLMVEALQGYPFEKLYCFAGEFSLDTGVHILKEAISLETPDLVLVGGSDYGRYVAATVATSLQTGLTADCTDFRLDVRGNVVQIRPAFGGNVIGEIVTETRRPQMATVRNHMFPPMERKKGNTIEVIHKTCTFATEYQLLDMECIEKDIDIAEAKKILVVGNGVQSIEQVQQIEALAKTMDFVVCCTRKVVERGLMAQSRQIGLSGQAVAPDMMITLGVSGSVQFLAGVKQAKTLIAINTDPTARIFAYAHIPFVGDIHEVLPILAENIKI